MLVQVQVLVTGEEALSSCDPLEAHKRPLVNRIALLVFYVLNNKDTLLLNINYVIGKKTEKCLT